MLQRPRSLDRAAHPRCVGAGNISESTAGRKNLNLFMKGIMIMRIQHNIPAMSSYRNYTNNTNALAKNLEKLSSGYKINRAGDDAAGLAISEKMRAQITGLEAAQKNVKDGTSLVKTAEGAMQEIHDMLNRMDYLATQSANGTYDNETDRAALQKEVTALKDEINRIAESANFNGIKLLDGKSLAGDLTEVGVKYDTVSTVKGLEIGEVTDGGGSNAQYTIDISKMFSEKDTIAVEIDGTAKTFTFTQAGTTATDFNGKTAEEQAASLASKMGVDSTIGANFNVSVEGTKITLTAKTEGTDNVPAVTKVTTTGTQNVGLTSPAAAAQAGTAGSGGTAYKGCFEVIGGLVGTGAAALQKGDKLTFNFKDLQGRDLSAEVTVTDKMISTDAKASTEALVEALNNAHFKDNADTTGVDESQMKVSDLFTLTANKGKDTTTDAFGSIAVTVTNAGEGGVAQAVGVELNRAGQKFTSAAVQGTAGSANGTAGKKDKWELDGSANGNNFTIGDKVKFEGKLSNGSTFEVELTAGTDFEIGTDLKASMGNLKTALESDKVNITVTNADKSTDSITGADLFSATGEFGITNAAGKLTIEANKAGDAATHGSSELTGITVTPIDDAVVVDDKVLATPQTAAQSTLKVTSELGYGAAVKVGDKTYEIVADARDTSSRNNEAVVVKDPTDSKAVAKALAEAIGKNEPNYTVTASNDGTVTVESKDIGSTQKALSISTPYGDKVTTASFKFDPKAVKEGSVLTFNGNKYEFVKAGGTAKSGYTAIEVDDFSKATAKSLGDAFQNVAKDGVVSVADDGTVTLKGMEADGVITNPTISFANNLRLQIGDTSDSFNQLTVDLSDMHTTAMGIDGLDISTQDGAAAAIDVIKNAINYVSDVRGGLGAIQNRLDHTANNLSVMAENIQDAESTIRDTDVAEEMMSYVKNNILVQSAQAMLAQANQLPQGVLQLLG